MAKRPILIIATGYIIGILLGLYFKLNIALFVAVFVIILMLCSLYKFKAKSINLKFVIIIVCAISISFSVICFKENRFENLYKEVVGETNKNSFIGKVVSIEKEGQYYYNFKLKIININGNKKYKNTNVLLRVKKNNKDVISIPEYGNLIYVTGVFELPIKRTNYKGFDYSEYLKTKDIYAISTVDSTSIRIVKQNALFVHKLWINNMKKVLFNNLKKLLPDNYSDIAIAFLLGNSDLLNDEQRELFSDASLSHILAISGMHVSFIVCGISFFLKFFDKRKGKYVFIFFLYFFLQLTGGEPSILRAVIMSCIAILSKLFYRKSDSLNNISIACLLLLISNPYNIYNLGFQLSFLGTLGIILFNSKINKKLENLVICKHTNNLIINKFTKKILEVLSVCFSANILLFPLIMYKFNVISFIFIVSNILVTPILGFMIFSGYITILISYFSMEIARILSVILLFSIKAFYYIAELCSKLSILQFLIVTPNISVITLLYVIIAYLGYFRQNKHHNIIIKLIAIFTMVIIMFKIVCSYNIDFTLYFIDVGQGDCSLIITDDNKRILIDGGGSEFGDYDVGKKVLVPYLLDRKIKTVDYMFISHFDSDHCKGLFYVMENLIVRNAVISKQGKNSENYSIFLDLCKRKKIKINYVEADNIIRINKNTSIEILWPTNNFINENVLNNNSLVFKVYYKDISILFTGDIEEIAENSILEKYRGDELSSTILKVAHHGSKSSSTQEFINKVNPKIALIGVGKNNKFGHPNYDVIERLKNTGANIYRTDLNGEIIINVDKKCRIKRKCFIND